jgi:hypothetical protein
MSFPRATGIGQKQNPAPASNVPGIPGPDREWPQPARDTGPRLPPPASELDMVDQGADRLHHLRGSVR